jgi:hypothetical protein
MPQIYTYNTYIFIKIILYYRYMANVNPISKIPILIFDARIFILKFYNILKLFFDIFVLYMPQIYTYNTYIFIKIILYAINVEYSRYIFSIFFINCTSNTFLIQSLYIVLKHLFLLELFSNTYSFIIVV